MLLSAALAVWFSWVGGCFTVQEYNNCMKQHDDIEKCEVRIVDED